MFYYRELNKCPYTYLKKDNNSYPTFSDKLG